MKFNINNLILGIFYAIVATFVIIILNRLFIIRLTEYNIFIGAMTSLALILIASFIIVYKLHQETKDENA